MKCIVDQSDYTSEEDAPQTGYYQWVTFFFAIQVIQYTSDYTLHSTPHRLYTTQYTSQVIQYTVHFTGYTVHNTLYKLYRQ